MVGEYNRTIYGPIPQISLMIEIVDGLEDFTVEFEPVEAIVGGSSLSIVPNSIPGAHNTNRMVRFTAPKNAFVGLTEYGEGLYTFRVKVQDRLGQPGDCILKIRIKKKNETQGLALRVMPTTTRDSSSVKNLEGADTNTFMQEVSWDGERAIPITFETTLAGTQSGARKIRYVTSVRAKILRPGENPIERQLSISELEKIGFVLHGTVDKNETSDMRALSLTMFEETIEGDKTQTYTSTLGSVNEAITPGDTRMCHIILGDKLQGRNESISTALGLTEGQVANIDVVLEVGVYNPKKINAIEKAYRTALQFAWKGIKTREEDPERFALKGADGKSLIRVAVTRLMLPPPPKKEDTPNATTS